MDIATTIFTGLCNGLGTASGSYLAIKYAVPHAEKMKNHFMKKNELEKEA